MPDDFTGYRTYDAPLYSDQNAPRTGPGGYPLGGYQGPQGGFEGFSYDPITGGAAPQGLAPGLQGRSGFAAAAAAILGGSRAAEGHLRMAYRGLFARRAAGALGARAEAARRLGFDSGAMGLSGGLARRIGFEQDAETIRYLGEAAGESTYGYHSDMSELAKGTGGELAGLKEREIGLINQSYWARKGIKQQNQQAWMGLAGDVIGGASRVAAAGMG